MNAHHGYMDTGIDMRCILSSRYTPISKDGLDAP